MYYQTMQAQSREKQQQLRQEARLHRSTSQANSQQSKLGQANPSSKIFAAAFLIATAAVTLIYII